MADDEAGDTVRDEIIRQGIGLAMIAAAAVLLDPVQRRNVRLAAQRAIRSVRAAVSVPPPRRPNPWELSALQQEARRITMEAADDHPV